MALQWLDSPLMLHSSRADTCKLTAEQCEYRSGHWRYWYQADHVYGHATVYFMCAIIGVFTISNLVSKFSKRSKPKTENANQIWNKFVAGTRFLSYKGFHLRGLKWHSPSIGVMLLGHPADKARGVTTEKINHSSKTLALLPFVMVASSKANYITLLTGISHEKLQVFHRWTSWAMFVLALIHTFPFIVFHVWKGDMMMQWSMNLEYWTGTAALIFQAYLNIMSVGVIRNRFYEFFKITYHIAICGFIIFFFVHCDFRLTSWDYFIAALTLYSASLLYSFLRTSLHSINTTASFTLLPDLNLQIHIPAPKNMNWKPGQHIFIKFYASPLHSYTYHPFTICSLPSKMKEGNGNGEMVFYIRPRKRITGFLKNMVEKDVKDGGGGGGGMAVSIDGPYGKSDIASTLSLHDNILLVAGGSGVGFLFPILESLLNENEMTRREIQVIIAVRHSDSATWVSDVMERIASSDLKRRVKIDIQITDESMLSLQRSDSLEITPVSSEPGSSSEKDLEKSAMMEPTRGQMGEERSRNGISVIRGKGRPDLKSWIGEMTRRAGTTGVTACGPSGMLLDVRDACAEAEMRVLRGEGSGVWLHTENFSW